MHKKTYPVIKLNKNTSRTKEFKQWIINVVQNHNNKGNSDIQILVIKKLLIKLLNFIIHILKYMIHKSLMKYTTQQFLYMILAIINKYQQLSI